MDLIAKAKDSATLLRLPKPVFDALNEAAKRNGRSRNSEVVVRLAESLGLKEREEKSA